MNESWMSQKIVMRKSQEKREVEDKRAVQREEEGSDRVRKYRRM